MGKIIICTGRLADKPYIVPGTNVELHSIEEICHYVTVNIYRMELSFFSASLLDFIKEELKLAPTADKIRNLIMGDYGLNDVCTALFCSCDLYDKEEILKTIKLLATIGDMPEWERRAYIGYKYLEDEKYLLALGYFRGTLKEENLSEKDYGALLKAMGICLLHISSFKEAADCFYKSFMHSREKKTLILTLLCLKLGNLGKEFRETVGALPKNDALVLEVEEIWKNAEKKAANSEKINNLEMIFEKLKTERVTEAYKEVDSKIEEFKAEYREGVWNGLVS